MGLWLKCPGCQIRNPLSLRVCPECGRSLDNLPQKLRVYVIGPREAAPVAPPAPKVKAAAGAEASKPVKQPKKPGKKKS